MTDNRAEAAKAALAAGVAFYKGDKGTAMKKGMESFGFVFNELKGGSNKAQASKAQQLTEQTRTAVADVIQFSGCRDEQTSADANINGGYVPLLPLPLLLPLAHPLLPLPRLSSLFSPSLCFPFWLLVICATNIAPVQLHRGSVVCVP